MADEETLGPLPAGRHGFSREQVAHNQRERLIAGLATAVAEKGYRAVTITDITKEARVSRRVFYENFEGKEECFLAAFEVVVGAHPRAGGGGSRVDRRLAPPGDRRRPRGARLLRRRARPCPPLPGRVTGAPAPRSPLASTRRCTRSFPIWNRAEPSAAASVSCPPPPRSRRSAPSSCSPRARSPPAKPRPLEDLLPDFREFILAPYLGAEEAARLAHHRRKRFGTPHPFRERIYPHVNEAE